MSSSLSAFPFEAATVETAVPPGYILHAVHMTLAPFNTDGNSAGSSIRPLGNRQRVPSLKKIFATKAKDRGS